MKKMPLDHPFLNGGWIIGQTVGTVAPVESIKKRRDKAVLPKDTTGSAATKETAPTNPGDPNFRVTPETVPDLQDMPIHPAELLERELKAKGLL